MAFLSRPWKSSTRADAAEIELALLRARLWMMEVSGGSATLLGGPAMPKSASSIRADAAEAELASLREQLKAESTKKFLKFSCKVGWCTHSGNCKSVHDDTLRLLKDRVDAMERELKQMQSFSLLRSEMECRIARVAKQVKLQHAKANQLELVIVMDCTGSMDPWIENAKSTIVSIIDNVKRDHPCAIIRVGFVAYRDFCDGPKRLEIQTLTRNMESVRSFISTLEACGGGDGPEYIPGGLAALLKMPFAAEAKRVVLVADYPCHGSKFHDIDDDLTYEREIEQSPDICLQMRELARRGIDFTFIEIEPTKTAKMANILEAEFSSTRSRDGFDREFQRVSLSNARDVVRYASIIHSSASTSISASKERSVIGTSRMEFEAPDWNFSDGTRRLYNHLSDVMEEEEDEEREESLGLLPAVKELDWNEAYFSRDIPAIRHSLHFRPGEHIDWTNFNLEHAQQDTMIRLTPSCFAKGAMRSAHAMYDCKMNKYLVAKFYFGKAACTTSASENTVEKDVKMQIVAKRLATEFSLCEELENGVDFIFTCWYEIKDPVGAGLSSSMSKFTAEPYISGQYLKYNNNNGWSSCNGLNRSDTAQAFSHFTWQKTLGQLMVVDLQGVGCIFTDPQIHSKRGNDFGCGNLSDAGMAAFFVTHECNDVCRALTLTPLKRAGLGWNVVSKTLEKKVKKKAKKSMTCSCPLCGSITVVLHSTFIQAYREGREVYCKSCVGKMKTYLRLKCCVCRKKVTFSPYWHAMKGIATPTSCKLCAASTDK